METPTKCNRYAARIPKEMGEGGWGGGVIGSLNFDVQEQGGGGGLAQFGPIQTDRKRGREKGTKIGHFFMDVINVWSLTETKLKFFT